MADTAPTFETAKRCPKCDMPGHDRSVLPTRTRGVTVHMIFCVNELCSWYETSWAVQVNADGSVPPPRRQQEKAYPKLAGWQVEAARRNIENAIERPIDERDGLD